MSIQSLDRHFFSDVEYGVLKELNKAMQYVSPDEGGEVYEPDDSGDYSPDEEDHRDKLNRQIIARRGQEKFRNALFKRYDGRCCVTGCSLIHLLEAAHIKPYRGKKDNHSSNGLLLRTDIHTLYDLDMLGIHPTKFTIHLNEEAKQDGYEKLEGIKLDGGKLKQKPSIHALKLKWELFLKNR